MMSHRLLQGPMDVQVTKNVFNHILASCGCPSICEGGIIRKYTPELIPIENSWEKDEAPKSLLQVTVPEAAS